MKDNGGPAFPMFVPEWHEHVSNDGFHGIVDFTMGMSLRDYFAAKAMVAILSSTKWAMPLIEPAWNIESRTGTDAAREQFKRAVAYQLQETACRSYEASDAMLKERAK